MGFFDGDCLEASSIQQHIDFPRATSRKKTLEKALDCNCILEKKVFPTLGKCKGGRISLHTRTCKEMDIILIYIYLHMYRDALDFSHHFLKMLLYIFLQAPPAFRDAFSSGDLLLILQFCFKLLESRLEVFQ